MLRRLLFVALMTVICAAMGGGIALAALLVLSGGKGWDNSTAFNVFSLGGAIIGGLFGVRAGWDAAKDLRQ